MSRIPRRSRSAATAWHQGFLAMLPAIRLHARIAFRDLDPEAREEAVQEAVCNALAAYVGLFRRGKVALAYPSVLARYAVAQARDGRKVGGHLNCKDVSSEYCQRQKRVVVERLDKFDKEDDQWLEAVVEDHRTPVAEQVVFRCDFPAWLASLPRRNRRIAQALSIGHTTGDVAQRFHVSAGRISQLRQELYRLWNQFHGDTPPDEQAVQAA
jgi:hypothetical protein